MSDDHQVVLMNCMVFQPRGVSCVSELDIAQLSNKQYIRKSYQSTMDLSKELQVDTNVFNDEILSDPGNGSSYITPPSDDKDKGITSGSLRIPPPKPPRNKHPSEEIIVKPSRPQQVEGQDRLPLLDAGSRVSSYAPMSSFKPRGHSRSKSESLKLNTFAPVLDTNKQDSSGLGEAMLGTSKELQLPLSPNSDSKRSRSPSPGKMTLSPKPSTLPGVGSSYDYHSKEDTKLPYCTLPRLILDEKGRITGNVQEKHKKQEDIYLTPISSENIDDDTKLANTPDKKEGVSEDSKMKYDNFLKELNTFNLRSDKVSPVSPNTGEECTVIGTFGQEQADDSKPADTGAFSMETPFTLSKMSKSNYSRRIKTKLRDKLSKHSVHNAAKPGSQIRNSSFISHDEDGSILENKSLTHLAHKVASEASNVILPDMPTELLTHPSRLLSHSEQEFSSNDDTGEMSPTWHCGDDCSDCKSFEDSDKVVLIFATANVICSISLYLYSNINYFIFLLA